MTMPGLVSREIRHRDGLVDVDEIWDVTVPGCPVIAMGSDVMRVTYRYVMQAAEYAEIAGKTK